MGQLTKLPLDRQIRRERQRIEHAQAKIRRVQDGYEVDPPVYTASEAEEKIGIFRDSTSRIEAEIHRLEEIKAQEATDEKTKDEAHRILETLRDKNLDSAVFSEKHDLITKLGIKVYPSGDRKVVRISSILHFDPCPLTLSPQKISIASPKL